MSKQEVLALLLPYYKEHLKVVKGMGSYAEAYSYLVGKTLQSGICLCLEVAFKIDVYGEPWITGLSAWEAENGGTYWGITPKYVTSMPEIVAALQTRIDIMESLLQTPATTNA